MENTKQFKFECLVFDTDNSSTITSTEALLHSIKSNSSICEKATLDVSSTKINDGDDWCLTVEKFDTEQDKYSGKSQAFLLKIEGAFNKLEPLRIPILKHIKKQDFNYLYVLIDEVSQKIAEDLYSLIYQV